MAQSQKASKNAPDPWETEALQAFDRGEKEVSSVEMLEGAPHLRLMRPLVTEKGCLQCHTHQGYEEGDILGGISVSFPMEPCLAVSRHTKAVTTGHGVLWLLGLIGLAGDAAELDNLHHRQSRQQKGSRSRRRPSSSTTSPTICPFSKGTPPGDFPARASLDSFKNPTILHN